MSIARQNRGAGKLPGRIQPRFSRKLLALCIATGSTTVVLPNTVRAQDLSWDITAGNTAVDGGTGTWDAATANWTSDAGATNQAWGDGDNAVFGGPAGTVTVSGTQAVDYITVQSDGYTLQGGALNFNTTNASGVTVEAGTTTISTDLTSTNGFNKAGDGSLVLSGSNSLAGILNVSRGNLTATNANALSDVSRFFMQSSNSGLNVDLGGATLSVDDLIVNSPGSSSLNNGTVSVSRLAQLGYGTINAVLAGAGELRKVLSYLTSLNGVNTLSGPVNINDGQLAVGATGSILNTSGITIAADGTLSVNGAGGNAISDTGAINNSGNFILTGSDETVGSVFGSGNIILDDNTLTTGDATDAEISGVISGAGDLVKEGAGTLTLSGTNTYAGGTAINDGVITTDNISALGTGTVSVNGGALTLASDLTIGALTGAGDVTLGANRLTAGGNNVSTTYSGVMSGAGGLTKTGSGEMILTGANTYTGETIVNAGTLTAGSADAFGTGATLRVGGGTADLGGFTTTRNSLIVQNGTLRNGTLNMTAGGQFQNATIDAVLSGVGAAISAGNGTSILLAANTFTGAIIANRGTFDITGSTVTDTVNITDLDNNGAGVVVRGNSLADTATVTISNSGVLTVAADETIGALAGGSATGSVVLNGDLTTGDAGDDVFAGVVSGAGDLIKQGTGTFTLSGVNTATGTLINNVGEMVVSGTWGSDVDNNATFDLTGTSTVTGTFFNNAAGAITNGGGGAVTLTGLSDFIGEGAINAGAGSITVSTENLTYRDGHSETGTVDFDVSDTITEERTTGPTWQGTGYTANFETAVDGVFTTGGDFTTTGGFTHDSSAALTVSTGDTMTVSSLTNTAGSVINVQTDASLVGTGNTTNNAGTVNVAGGGSLVEVTGDYNNLATGVVNFNDAAAKDFDVQAGLINNAGTLNFNAGTTMVNSVGGAIQNSGTGDINIADGATLNATGDAINNAGAIDMAGTGSVLTVDTLTNNTGGVVNAQGTLNSAVLNQGTGDFNIVGNLTALTLDIINTDAATLDAGAGTTTVIRNLTNTTTSGTGVTVANGAGLNAAVIQNGLANGSAASLITNNGGLYSDTSITNFAGATLNSNTANSLVTYENTLTNNGTVAIQGRIGGQSVINSGAGAAFNVVGDLNAININPLNAFTNQNSALLNVGGGTFWLDTLTNTSGGTGTSLATAGVQVAADGGLVVAGALTNNGLGTINNAGTIDANTIANGDGANAATLTNSGTLTSLAASGTGITSAGGSTLVSSGTLDASASADAAAFLNAGVADIEGTLLGNVTNTGDFEATGDLAHTGALINNGGGTVTVSAGVMATTGSVINASTAMGTTLGNAGINIAAGAELEALTLVNSATSSTVVTGTLDTTSGTTSAINNLGTMTFDATGVALGGLDNSGTLTSTGQLNEGLINTGTATLSNQVLGAVQNSTGGQLSVAGDLTMDNSLTNAAGALVDVDAGTLSGITALTNRGAGSGNGAGSAGFEIDAGATVSATEVLNTDNATLYVAGTLISGNAISNSAGAQLTSIGALEGDLTNSSILSLQGLLDGDLINDGGLTTITGALAGTGGADTGTVTNRNGGSLVLGTGSSFTFDWLDNDALSTVTLNGATLGGTVTNAGTLSGAGIIARQLNNTGTVDLVNGTTGDQLRINGGLTGAGTYNLDLDLTSATPSVDRLIITGDTTGDLALAFNTFAGTPVLLNAPLVVVDVDESANNDFTFSTSGLSGVSGPVVLYASQATPNGDILVTGGASPTLGALMEGVAQVEALTNQSAGRLASHQSEICGGSGVSARFTSGEATTDAQTESSQQSAEMEVVSDYQGVEIGANLGCISQLDGWDLNYNLLGGTNNGTTRQTLAGAAPTATSMDFEQFYAGVATSATRGALTADLQLRYGQSEYSPDVSAGSDAAALGLSADTFNAQNTSLDGAVSYRIPVGQSGFAVVPQGGVSITRTSVDKLNFVSGETLEADDYTTTSGYVGATMQYFSIAANGQSAFNAYVGGSVQNTLSEAQKITLTDTSGSQASLTTSGVDDFAEISIGVDYTSQIDVNRQFNVGLRADSRIGDDVKGYAVALEMGLRF